MENGRAGWVRRVLDAPASRGRTPAQEIPAAPPAPRVVCVDHGSVIEGTLTLDRSLEIDGEFRGAIDCRETVTVGEAGSAEANIRARCVVIRGAVVGDVEATREVILHTTGRLHGNVSTPSIAIERGAFFNGETRMYRPELMAQAHREAEIPVGETAASRSDSVAAPAIE